VIPKISQTASGLGFDPAEQAGKVADALAPNRIRDPKEPPHSAEAIANKSANSSSYQKQTTAAGTTAGLSESPPDRIANLESEMRELKAMIATLVASQTRIPSTPPPADTLTVDEQPEYPATPMRNTPGTVRLPPVGNAHSPLIPVLPRQYTEDPSSRYKKSTILEKITPLSNGIEYTFLQWSALIQDRLVVNEDHYPTDNEFDDMQMGEKGHSYETFPEFKARFQSAAITGQVSQSEWF
ncbi:hypothetical protein V496_01828, partial [Pseudogymnoascus sp. VKM F-4515 (FW-2607)]